jgi:hypothetical protein
MVKYAGISKKIRSQLSIHSVLAIKSMQVLNWLTTLALNDLISKGAYLSGLKPISSLLFPSVERN